VSQPSVTLGPSATVNGSVQTDGALVNLGATITGSVTSNSPVGTDASIQATVSFPLLAAPVVVGQGAVKTLAPGAYGSVLVSPGGELSLSSGTYELTSVNVLAGALVHLDETAGPVLIYVQGGFQFAGTETQTGGDGNVLVGVFGLGDAALLTAPFRGTVSAQNGEIELNSTSGTFAGAYFASNIQIDPNTTVTGIGAVTPPGTSGLSPTFNCVTQFDATHFGAVFGYTSTATSNVVLGTGPHNFVSPGPADANQPILFVPGSVPIATFQVFPVGQHVTFTLGQQSARATIASAACPTAFGNALVQVFGQTNDSVAVLQSLGTILSNPNFPTFINSIATAGAPLTSAQSAALNAIDTVLANTDLVAAPSTLNPSQVARLPAFHATLQANPFVQGLRLAGDAQRAIPANIPCNYEAIVNGTQPVIPLSYALPEPGSIYQEMLSLDSSSSLQNVQATLTNVQSTSATAAALLAAPGTTLALLTPGALADVQLPGSIPTSFGSFISGLIGGGGLGAALGSIGGPVGAAVGAVVGGIVGGIVGAADPNLIGQLGSDFCQPHCGSDSDCMTGDTCAGGCCTSGPQTGTIGSFLSATSGNPCAAEGTSTCVEDGDCDPSGLCLDGCCASIGTFTLCGGQSCSDGEACPTGETCQQGCCTGPCGFQQPCNDTIEVATCSASTGPTETCPSGDTCVSGCCQAPAGPPPK
jgi:hypothetical protein